MSQWITDRLPTKQDAPNGHVCIAHDDTITVIKRFDTVVLGTPWKPFVLLPPNTEPGAYADYTDYLRAEVERLTELCTKQRYYLHKNDEALRQRDNGGGYF